MPLNDIASTSSTYTANNNCGSSPVEEVKVEALTDSPVQTRLNWLVLECSD